MIVSAAAASVYSSCSQLYSASHVLAWLIDERNAAELELERAEDRVKAVQKKLKALDAKVQKQHAALKNQLPMEEINLR